jgi:hypothetical protein
MNILNFTTQFPDEASCKEYREQEEVVCPHYGSKEYYWKSDREEVGERTPSPGNS